MSNRIGLQVKVHNMESSKGNTVPNQFIIQTRDGKYFQSYSSIIAFIPYPGKFKASVLLDEHFWDYSVTTNRYRNMFLGETKAETEKKIASGEYHLVDLN